MLSLSTAQLLFVVALALAPHNAQTIYATSSTNNYFWTETTHGWTLKTKGLPSTCWSDGGTQPAPQRDADMRTVQQHHWSRERQLFLDNGNRVEEQGDAVFYTIEPGEANQQVFTIFYSTRR